MYSPRLTRIYFAVEGVNSLATTYFFYYIYFFTKDQFGFSKVENLVLAATIGLAYGISSFVGGRVSQRRGYFYALKLGFGIMAVSFGCGAFVSSLPLVLLLIFIANFGMALTWPSLEALVSEGQPPDRLQRNIGIYNVMWSGFGALAYFTGGAMIKALGYRAMFLVPAALQACHFFVMLAVERRAGPSRAGNSSHHAAAEAPEDLAEQRRSPVSPATFLKMAWIANPFGYLAINTVVAVIPVVASRLDFSVSLAGVVCSVWLFVRTGAFVLLWLWKGWHYRFRWLIGGYIAMGASFVALLIAPTVLTLVMAQVFFGLGLGLLYYSSLYYSMHVGETKGEHGGVHEAMIGAGSCAGPAVGALTLHFLPQYASSGTYAVAGMLLCGLAALSWLRRRG